MYKILDKIVNWYRFNIRYPISLWIHKDKINE
jgi:hypothetical protein